MTHSARVSASQFVNVSVRNFLCQPVMARHMVSTRSRRWARARSWAGEDAESMAAAVATRSSRSRTPSSRSGCRPSHMSSFMRNCVPAAPAAIRQNAGSSFGVGCMNRVKKYAKNVSVPTAVARAPKRRAHTAVPEMMTNTASRR